MDTHDIEGYFQQHRRTLGVLLLAVGMAAVSGVFVGIRQTVADTAPTDAEPPAVLSPAPTDLPPAPKYGDIPQSDWLANQQWHFTLDNLPRTETSREPGTALTADELAAVILARGERRAFDGAPPTVPHEINQLNSASCITCHGPASDFLIGGKRPAAMSHPYYANCTQCHVPADGLRSLTEEERLFVANSFGGRAAPGQGSRAFPGAPPTVPHAVFMRQNCMSCHGPDRPNAIRSSHPERQNCLQCHAQDATLDNREQLMNPPPPVKP